MTITAPDAGTAPEHPQPVLYRELPASIYTDPARFDQELEDVFGQTWLLATPLGVLPETGGYPVTVGRRSLVITRDGDTVRAFYNVCSHRGSAVIDEPCDAKRLRCAYHGWTYGLDGTLVALPGQARFGDGLDMSACALPAVNCEVWNGFVWVHLGQPEGGVEEALGDFADELARYRCDEQRVMHTRVETVPLNWKAVVDAFNETYHVPFIHRGTVGRLVEAKATWFTYAKANSRMVVPVRESLASAEGRDDARSAPSATGKNLLSEQAEDHCNYMLFPNVILDYLPRWGVVTQYEPIDLRTTELRVWMMTDLPRTPEHEESFERQWAELSKVLSEDVASQGAIGRGINSSAFKTVRLGGEEERLVHFHREVGGLIGDWVE
ncbi:MAG: aromatic ring-hydroxylating oxygenase subunit alpha [Microthrixaceae bacterium]